jgi:hypothetical protein
VIYYDCSLWCVILHFPASLYAELESPATDEQTDLVEVTARLVAIARECRAWLRDLMALCKQTRQDGSLQVGTTFKHERS